MPPVTPPGGNPALRDIVSTDRGNWNSYLADLATPQSLVPPPIRPKSSKRNKVSEDGTSSILDTFSFPEPSLVESDSYLPYFPELFKQAPQNLVAPKTLVGIEVEIENVRKIGPNVCNVLWCVKDDGSLRNNGKEFVTPGVIPMSAAEPALNMLFNELNPDIDFSKRTSIHVHLDVRQLQFKQLLGLLYTYSVVENLLFKFVGNDRRSNIFCVPLGETGVMLNINKNPVQFMYHIEKSWHKYTALNLLPIANLGSVEFRHMPGTKNVQQLLHWLDLIGCLKVYAYKHSLEDIVANICQLNSNSRYHQFVEGVFGDCCIYLDMSNLLKDMEKYVYMVKHCSAANSFHTKVINSQDSESQLGKRLNNWMRKLTPSQQIAILQLADIHGNSDAQALFKAIQDEPAPWKSMTPREYRGHIDTIINPPDAKPITKAGRIKPIVADPVLEMLDEFDESE